MREDKGDAPLKETLAAAMIARRVASAYSARRETVLVLTVMATRVALYQI